MMSGWVAGKVLLVRGWFETSADWKMYDIGVDSFDYVVM